MEEMSFSKPVEFIKLKVKMLVSATPEHPNAVEGARFVDFYCLRETIFAMHEFIQDPKLFTCMKIGGNWYIVEGNVEDHLVNFMSRPNKICQATFSE